MPIGYVLTHISTETTIRFGMFDTSDALKSGETVTAKWLPPGTTTWDTSPGTVTEPGSEGIYSITLVSGKVGATAGEGILKFTSSGAADTVIHVQIVDKIRADAITVQDKEGYDLDVTAWQARDQHTFDGMELRELRALQVCAFRAKILNADSDSPKIKSIDGTRDRLAFDQCVDPAGNRSANGAVDFGDEPWSYS